MQSVKCFPEGTQLQGAKSLKVKDKWLLLLEFHPSPKGVLFGVAAQDLCIKTLKSKSSLSHLEPLPVPVTHPFQLYCRSHFVGQRLKKITVVQDVLQLEFAEAYMIVVSKQGLEFRKPDVIKPYVLQVNWANLDFIVENESEAPQTQSVVNQEQTTLERKFEKKLKKLSAAIEKDLEVAQHWLNSFSGICTQLEANPELWARSEAWSAADLMLIQNEIAKGSFPSFGKNNIGLAQKKIFQMRRRALKTIEMASQRLEKIKAEGVQSLIVRAQKKAQITSTTTAEQTTVLQKSTPRKKPGIWVRFPRQEGELWARVGRSADENAELFRQAKDRDLWFHVRALQGAHVWIPRGQKGFGAKEEATADLIEWGCQLALWNSKAKKQNAMVVDYTERRYLKTIKGAGPGQVQIQRSQTRLTQISSEFESLMRGE